MPSIPLEHDLLHGQPHSNSKYKNTTTNDIIIIVKASMKHNYTINIKQIPKSLIFRIYSSNNRKASPLTCEEHNISSFLEKNKAKYLAYIYI